MTVFWEWLKSLFKKSTAVPAIEEVPVAKPVPAAGEITAEDISPWLTWLIKHQGQKEIPGVKHNLWIVNLFKFTSYKTNKDETPWCAACINAALNLTGYKGTNSAAAASFDKYGTETTLKPGAIITVRHANGGRHVTCLHHIVDKHNIACIGGNQNNQVKISVYNISGNAKGHDELMGCRWPVKK
jgi:uncharacterized protein (TIGR02594 family)